MECAEFAQGSWQKALLFSEDDAWDLRTRVFRFLDSPGSELDGLMNWALKTDEKGNENLSFLVDFLEQTMLKLIQWTFLKERDSFLPAPLLAYARNKGEMRFFWVSCAEKLAQTRQKLPLPLNRKLLIQEILLPFLGC